MALTGTTPALAVEPVDDVAAEAAGAARRPPVRSRSRVDSPQSAEGSIALRVRPIGEA